MARLLVVFITIMLGACASAPRAPAFDPAGIYDIITEFNGGSLPGTLTLQRGSAGLTGTVSAQTGEMALSRVTVDGRKLSFSALVQNTELVMNIEFTENDRFTGTWSIPGRFTGTVSGTRRVARS